ncbi:MAG TPA: hypothetical protein VG602_06655 [Actinomycetota bacterium]|nr:hypothetical protein [Actinomycetota bacterium]
MPTTLRSRIALFVLMTMFLIPVSVSTLRGLTHVLTCQAQVATPFSLILQEEQQPTVISASRIERQPEGEEQVTGRLCGGLSVDLRARSIGPGEVEMHVPITNHTNFPWQGTVLFQVGKTAIPIDVGSVGPGKTASDVVNFSLDPGQHEVTGSLLIGP